MEYRFNFNYVLWDNIYNYWFIRVVVMIISDRTRLIIRTFCLIVLIALCILVWYNGKDLKCNQCVIQFEDTQVGGQVYTKFNVSLERLYHQFMSNESCPLTYRERGGFFYDGT